MFPCCSCRKVTRSINGNLHLDSMQRRRLTGDSFQTVMIFQTEFLSSEKLSCLVGSKAHVYYSDFCVHRWHSALHSYFKTRRSWVQFLLRQLFSGQVGYLSGLFCLYVLPVLTWVSSTKNPKLKVWRAHHSSAHVPGQA